MDGTKILGIDPALGTTGYGVLQICGTSVRLVDAGTIRCGRGRPIEQRLKELHAGVLEIIQRELVDTAAVAGCRTLADINRTRVRANWP